MGASIYYQVSGTYLDVGGGRSSFVDLLRRVLGGDYPWDIGGHRIHELRGAAAATENHDHRRALKELIEAIEKHGAVRVWAEF